VHAYVFARARFEAGHFVDGHSRHARVHGHTWHVEVISKALIDPRDGRPSEEGSLVDDLGSLARELDLRDIGAMLPGSRGTAHEVGSWFLERLLPAWPLITRVTVGMGDDEGVSITRDPF
jgi:hypothetical protein